MRALLLALVTGVACAAPAAAQSGVVDGVVDGHASATVDHLPGGEGATELRVRLFVERGYALGERVRIRLSGWAEGLAADRGGAVGDAAAMPHEAYLDVRAGQVDLRAGLASTVWGRLDEVQPTDVINPLDVSRYFFEGRSQARLPVLQVRARWFTRGPATVEAVWVPLFRRGRFDALDEPSSPFNLLADADPCVGQLACVAGRPRRDPPPRAMASSQGGVRVGATTRRVDWSLSAYRGIQPFGTLRLDVAPFTFPPTVTVVETFPRFTMIGGDLETVRGPWTVRAEAAVRVDDTLTAPVDPAAPVLRVEEGRSFQAGAGADRKAGGYQLNTSVLVEGRDAATFGDLNVSLVGGGERTFSRDTIRVRVFGLWNLSDAAGFARMIAAWSLRDNLWLEGSIGQFVGEGDDALSRFSRRDFLYLRLKTYF